MMAQKSILVTGGTGMIGRMLVPMLQSAGYVVTVFSRGATRKKNAVQYIHWNPAKNIIDKNTLCNTDAIIHLAGAGIADARWTTHRKKVLRESRTKGIHLISQILSNHKHRCQQFICAGGVGFYGVKDRLKTLTESHPPADDFVARLCVDWENAVKKINTLGIATTIFRTGIVLDFKSGALQKMLPVFRWGLGAPLGNGKQAFPWISLYDICAMYLYAVQNKLTGIYNATAPEQITNADFSKALATFLNRPFLMPALPAFLLKVFLGKRATLLLTGNKINADKIQTKGVVFRHKTLADFLNEQ